MRSDTIGEDKYAWQQKTFQLWSATGFKGLLWASPSSGKTHAGHICIQQYLEYFPLNKIWVVANTKEVINQWKKECDDILDIEYFTYLAAVSRFEKLKREEKTNLFPKLLVLDECHLVMAPASGRVLDYGVPHVLGMSGTPNHSEKKIGQIFQRVTFKEANIAETTVHMVKFPPTEDEMKKYQKATNSIDNHRIKFPYSTYYNDPLLQRLYLRRRQTAYRFNSRLKYAVRLVEQNKGRTIMCFCMLQEQAKELSMLLHAKGIDNTLHLSTQEGLQRFLDGDVKVCISCKKLQVGFNCPAADVGIIVSTATAPLTATQTLARVIRPMEGKHADVYFLLAEGTSDESLIKDKDLFIKEAIKEETIQ